MDMFFKDATTIKETFEILDCLQFFYQEELLSHESWQAAKLAQAQRVLAIAVGHGQTRH